MKFLLDNNLPPPLARALHELTYDNSNKKHEVAHLRANFLPNTPDTEWIEALAKEGDWVVITHDKLNKGLEREALRQAGLIVFFLDKSWSPHNYWDKAHQLVRWWPLIIEQAERISGGATFRVKWNLGKRQFIQITI